MRGLTLVAVMIGGMTCPSPKGRGYGDGPFSGQNEDSEQLLRVCLVKGSLLEWVRVPSPIARRFCDILRWGSTVSIRRG